MRITREEALSILGVDRDATVEEIRTNYKRLALKWHPDKQDGTIGKDEATRLISNQVHDRCCYQYLVKKFQEVSAAYKKLTTKPDSDTEDEDDGMTLGEMMELFAQLFSFRNSVRHCSCHNHHHYYNYDDFSDDDYDDYTDEDSDDEFWESIASRLRNKWEARKFMQKDTTDYSGSRITEEEALKNAQELIEQEEIEKKRKEKKKAKKKRKKEKKKQKEKETKVKEEKENDKKSELKEEASAVKREKEKDEKPQIDKTTKNNLPNGFIHAEKHEKHKFNNISKSNDPTTDDNVKNNKKKVIQEDIGPIPLSNKNEPKGQQKRQTTNIKTSSDEDDAIDTNSAFFARVASKAPTTTQPPSRPSSSYTSKENTENKVQKERPKTDSMQEKKENIKPTNKPASNKKDTKSNNKRETKPPDAKQNHQTKNSSSSTSQINDQLDAVVLKSRQIAVKGNELASKEDYHGAIKMFTQAIQLDPTDFRFFGNRSYCHDRVGQYSMALQDSEAAIHLAPEWAKGYFRKGRALTGLERYQEAEAAFQQVLKLDVHCEDAQFELARVRVQILTDINIWKQQKRMIKTESNSISVEDMGFERPLAEEAVRTFGTVQSSLEALLAGKVTPKAMDDEVYHSDGEDNPIRQTPISKNQPSSKSNTISSVSNNQSSKKPTIITPAASQSRPIFRCPALWVGNVDPQHLNEKSLTQLFSKVGKVVNVKILPEKYCAFINYANPEDTVRAIEKLQGYEVGGQYLLIRYPNNPPPGSVVPPVAQAQPQSQPQQKQQNTSTSSATAASKKSVVDKNNSAKLSGPVNGDECYFWRTTGCAFNNQCRYKHVPSHKGIDLQKVRAKYGNHL